MRRFNSYIVRLYCWNGALWDVVVCARTPAIAKKLTLNYVGESIIRHPIQSIRELSSQEESLIRQQNGVSRFENTFAF